MPTASSKSRSQLRVAYAAGSAHTIDTRLRRAFDQSMSEVHTGPEALYLSRYLDIFHALDILRGSFNTSELVSSLNRHYTG
jgi:hypothetical protein